MEEFTLARLAQFLVLSWAACIVGGVACGFLIGPNDNKSVSAVMGGALAGAGTIPGLAIGFLVGLLL
jgi:hypothetical protein